MAQTALRTATFLLGPFGLYGLELLAPDRPPTAPHRKRWVSTVTERDSSSSSDSWNSNHPLDSVPHYRPYIASG